MSNLSERLKELRKQNHLSQADVAKRLGSTPALVSAYETYKREPSLDKLVLLADMYHTSTDYILGRKETTNNSVLLDVTHLSEKQINILRNLIDDMSNK